MDIIAQLEAEQIAGLGKAIPDFKAGDTVRVGYKVTEGTRTRVQNYEGVVIGRKGGATISAARASSPSGRPIHASAPSGRAIPSAQSAPSVLPATRRTSSPAR